MGSVFPKKGTLKKAYRRASLLAVREVKEPTAEDVEIMIDKFLEGGGIDDLDRINEAYLKLSDTEKTKVGNYESYRSVAATYLKESVGDNYIPEKPVRFDLPEGCRQLSWVQEAMAEYSNVYKTNGEKGSTKITSTGYSIRLHIGFPFVSDISQYDTLTFYVYNTGNKDHMMFNPEVEKYGLSPHTVLTSRQWTKVVYNIEMEKTLNDRILWIYEGDWGKAIPIGTEFYISSLTLGHAGDYKADGAELREKIAGLAVSEWTKEELLYIRKNYESLPMSERVKVYNYDDYLEFVASYFLSENDVAAKEDTLIYFDMPVGIEQVTPFESVFTMATEKSIKLPGENGSTKLTCNGYQIRMRINFPAVVDIGSYDRVVFSIFDSNTDGVSYSVYNEHDQRIGKSTKIPLSKNEWTEISYELDGQSGISGCDIWLYRTEWNGVGEGKVFYISSVKLVRDGEKPTVDTETLIDVSKDGTTRFTTETSGEGAALLSLDESTELLRFVAGTDAYAPRLYFRGNIDVSGYRALTFRVFNAYDRPLTLVSEKPYNGKPVGVGNSEQQIRLQPGQWTQVTVLLDNTADLDGRRFQFYVSGWGKIPGATLYFDDIQGIKAV